MYLPPRNYLSTITFYTEFAWRLCTHTFVQLSLMIYFSVCLISFVVVDRGRAMNVAWLLSDWCACMWPFYSAVHLWWPRQIRFKLIFLKQNVLKPICSFHKFTIIGYVCLVRGLVWMNLEVIGKRNRACHHFQQSTMQQRITKRWFTTSQATHTYLLVCFTYNM